MAFRIGSWVRSGTIDNTERGQVRGTFHLEGVEDPLTFELRGNTHPDLAGCRLEFRNPRVEPVDPEIATLLRPEQRGHAGNISASRKRRVPRGFPDDPVKLPLEDSDFVLVTVLYIEWFDSRDGRVVIEGVGYEWEVDLPRWEITAEEISAQEEQARQAADLFMNRALEHFEDIDEEIRALEEEIDPEADDEFSWEKRLKNSEERVEAILALLDEAETDEERSRLLDRAFASRLEGAEQVPEFEAEPLDDLAWEGTSRIQLDEDLKGLVDALGKENDRLIHEPTELEDEPETSGELLTLAVKVRTACDLLLEDEAPSEPGFLIALLKREIARCHSVIGALGGDGSSPRHRLFETVWTIRDQLVELAGKLRNGDG